MTAGATTTRVYRTRVTHVRRTPLRNAFTYSSRWWLVDVDHLPQLPALLRPFVRFEARDHLGDASATLRHNVERHLAGEGVPFTGGRIILLTAPRSLGRVFNPLSVFWCTDDDGTPVATLAEVHNTYGGRHVYTVRADERGRGEVDKAFYVSPFNDTSGRYSMSLPEPGHRLHLSVTLHRDGQAPFVASVRGRGEAATAGAVVRTLLASPVEAVRTLALIRWQGVRLWLRRLPVQPRPATDEVPHDHAPVLTRSTA